MTDEPQIEVFRVLPKGGPGTLTLLEANAILEVAFLATAADDDLSEDELVAFRGLAGALRGLVGSSAGSQEISDDELDGLLDEFSSRLEHHDAVERLAALALVLARPVAKDTAYKVSFAMALCDLAENDDEEDFDDELVAALGLTEEHADDLAAEVYEAIGEEEDEAIDGGAASETGRGANDDGDDEDDGEDEAEA